MKPILASYPADSIEVHCVGEVESVPHSVCELFEHELVHARLFASLRVAEPVYDSQSEEEQGFDGVGLLKRLTDLAFCT